MALSPSAATCAYVGVVERRLEELVLQDQTLVLAETRIDLLQGVLQAVLPTAHVVLAGVVRPLGEPDLQIAGARGIHHVDAGEVVVDRLAADALVVVGEGAELVVLVLEGVRVDRAQLHAEVFGMAAEGAEVVDEVPRDVERDGRGQSRQTVHLGGIRDLLERIARGSRGREDAEARAGVAECPGRQFDRLPFEGGQDLGGEGGHGRSFSTAAAVCRMTRVNRFRQ
jgi:hypothetical protein